MSKTLTGTVIEVGTMEAEEGDPSKLTVGLVIETTKEALRDFAGNLAYARVVVTLAEDGGK